MRKLLLTALLTAPVIAMAAPVNLIKNGSFEDNLVDSGTASHVVPTDWKNPAARTDLENNLNGALAQEGNNFAVVGNSILSQSLNTVANTEYQLSFYYSSAPNTTLPSSFTVTAGDFSQSFALKANPSGANDWQHFVGTFTAASDATLLRFSVPTLATNSNLAAFDNIGVVSLDNPVAAVPEPETYALMLAGLATLGFVARRRKA